MPAFYFLVFIGLVLLWFLLAFAFKPIGKVGYKLWKDAKDAMSEVDKNEIKDEKEQENK